MKARFFLVVFLSCWSTAVNSQTTSSDSIVIINTLDKNVLKYLIKNVTLDHFGNAVWTPADNEKFEFPISDDGKCHTSLDTILYYKGIDLIKRAVVILRTYQFDNKNVKYGSHYEGSPVSVALFEKYDSNRWKLIKFSKRLTSLGYYVGAEKRYKGIIELKRANSNYTYLYCKQMPGGQQGYVEGYESMYWLDDNPSQREIFSQVYYNDYSLTNLKVIDEK